jgi:short-subunit dehydrogenase
VLTLSQSLQSELGASSVYVQAVLPPATRTEIWERSGRSIDDLKITKDADELVEAALVGFDRREPVTITVAAGRGAMERLRCRAPSHTAEPCASARGGPIFGLTAGR